MIREVRSAVVGAPVEQVWPLLRDFGGWASWHPVLAACRLLDGVPGGVGAVRDLRLKTGERLREQLIALSDREMSCTWCLVQASAPVDAYVVSVRLRRVTHGHCSFVEWRGQVEAPHSRRSAVEQLLGGTLADPAIAGLQTRFPSNVTTTGGSLSAASILDASRAFLLPLREKVDRAPRETGEGSTPPRSRERPLNRPFGAPSPARGEGEDARREIETTAIVVERHGGPEVLRPVRIAVPPPGPGEVRLHHAFIGVNMIDVHGRAGDFGLGTLPAIPGMEAAGTVLHVGPGVDHLRRGDRVAYAGRPPGAYAEVRTLPADMMLPLPPDLDDRTAAASILKGLTADLLLHDVHPLQAGELVLVHAAAGGLGLILCSWARALGATVIGVVSRDSKVDAAAAAGCATVIVSSREDVAQTVRDMTRGRGVHLVFDAIGRVTFETSLASLAPRGHLVSFGQVSGPVGARDIDALASASIRLSRPNFADYVDTPEALRHRTDRLFAALSTGQARPVIDSIWPLSQAAEAHRRLGNRDAIGSILLSTDRG